MSLDIQLSQIEHKPICVICKDGLKLESSLACVSCGSTHHPECYTSVGKCGAGCGNNAVVLHGAPQLVTPPGDVSDLVGDTGNTYLDGLLYSTKGLVDNTGSADGLIFGGLLSLANPASFVLFALYYGVVTSMEPKEPKTKVSDSQVIAGSHRNGRALGDLVSRLDSFTFPIYKEYTEKLSLLGNNVSTHNLISKSLNALKLAYILFGPTLFDKSHHSDNTFAVNMIGRAILSYVICYVPNWVLSNKNKSSIENATTLAVEYAALLEDKSKQSKE